jgi:hypothetical protein
MSIARSREIEAEKTMKRFIWIVASNYTICFLLNVKNTNKVEIIMKNK